MNTNNNVYTVIYSTVLVMVVAAVLAFAAISLQPRQNENIKIETITKVLSAAGLTETEDVMPLYAEKISDAFYVDGNGQKVGSMNTGKENIKDIKVASTGELKKQNDIIKQIEAGKTDLIASLKLPVYIFDIDGTAITVIPCYGAGLWGPIWGYIAVAEDGKTIEGAIFDHKSETPGLGAKIAEEPFYSQFKGKSFADGKEKFSIIKGGAHGDIHGVDAISGATITSQALGKTINTWVKYYEPYLNGLSNGCCKDACCGDCKESCCGHCEDNCCKDACCGDCKESCCGHSEDNCCNDTCCGHCEDNCCKDACCGDCKENCDDNCCGTNNAEEE